MFAGATLQDRGGGHRREAVEIGALPAACPQPLRGRVICPHELDGDQIALWKQFCEAGDIYRSPFYWPQFTLAVASCRSDARVAVLELAGRIVGFLPFHLVQGRVGKPIGAHINDYHGPILAPGVAIGASDLLRAAGLDAYDFNHLPSAIAGLSSSGRGTLSSPQMDLANGYDAYAKARDASWTKAQREIGRRYRKTEAELGPIRFRFHDHSSEVFRQLVTMKNTQYARLDVRMRIDQGWAGEVLERLRQTQEPDFAGVVSTLHAGDRLIAAHFGLRTADLLHWWFPAYELALSRLGPGKNLVNQCAIAAGDQGIRRIDFGKGDEDFKLHFANREVRLREGSLVVPGTLSAMARRGGEAVVAAARRIPLGRYRDYPGKAIARLVSGVGVPD
jgi:CelD/BcsL family acetyltransferase involved in cellulose biosynthesis